MDKPYTKEQLEHLRETEQPHTQEEIDHILSVEGNIPHIGVPRISSLKKEEVAELFARVMSEWGNASMEQKKNWITKTNDAILRSRKTDMETLNNIEIKEDLKRYQLSLADHERLHKWKYHAPHSPLQTDRYEQLNIATHFLAQMIMSYCPPGRQSSIALTKLEEVRMWANNSIAMEELDP